MGEYIDVTYEYLREVEEKTNNSGFPTQKWVLFCRVCLDRRWTVRIRPAETTRSKYILVISKGKRRKVRFSDHRPNREREENGDCDILVGAKNSEGKWINWEEAIILIKNYFAIP